jgi:hypothetical protein
VVVFVCNSCLTRPCHALYRIFFAENVCAMGTTILEDGTAYGELLTEEIRAARMNPSVHGGESLPRRNVANVFQCSDALSAAITILLILIPLTSSGIKGSDHACHYCMQVNMVFDM